MRRQPALVTLGVLAASLMILSPATVQAAVTISAAATRNIVCSAGVCTPTHKGAVLNVTDLENLLAASNVQVTTGSGSLAALTSDIVVTTPFTWSSTSVLTLDAYHSITIGKTVSVSGTGGVSFVTNDGGTGGSLSFGANGHVNFSSLTSSLAINGATYTLVGNIATLASDIATNPSGDFALASSYDAKADGTYNASPITEFDGSFEGLGNAISNLTIVDDSDEANTGLFAENDGEIRDLGLINIYVKTTQPISVGGLAGENDGTLSGDSTSGRLFGAERTGGLVGVNGGIIVLSHSSAAVHCSGHLCKSIGGLVGFNDGNAFGRHATIETSYASGSVTSPTEGGGLVGSSSANPAAISNCYATGAVNGGDGKSSTLGGLVGSNFEPISSSYSTGSVTGSAGKHGSIGGLVGADGSDSIATSYWDTTTSGITDPSQGAGNTPNEPGITGLTTAQLQSGLPTGFDPAVWGQSASINGGLPYLLANPPP